MKNKGKWILLSLAIIVFVILIVIYSHKDKSDYSEFTEYSEELSLTYDVGQYLPEEQYTNKDIKVSIVNLDEYDIPDMCNIQDELDYFVNTSSFFTKSVDIELEYFIKDDTEENTYLFKFKDYNLYGSYIDEAYIFNFWYN